MGAVREEALKVKEGVNVNLIKFLSPATVLKWLTAKEFIKPA